MNRNPLPADAPAPASLGAPQNAPLPGQAPWQGWAQPPAAKPRLPVEAAPLDGGAALLALLAGWLFLRLVTTPRPGLGVTLYTLGFALWVLAYRRLSGLPIPRESLPWLGVMLLSALNFSLVDNGPLAFLNILFLIIVTAYWVGALGGSRLENRLGPWVLADLRNQLFIIPFQNFGCLGAAVKNSFAKTKGGKGLLTVALSLILSAPLAWYVCLELSRVEEGFAGLLGQLEALVRWESLLSPSTILAIPVGCYLFGLIYGNQHRRYTHELTPEKLAARAARRRVLPAAAAYTLLTLLCLIYALFFLSGAVSLAGFLSARGLTPYDYSQFARQGFFELCRVSVVNLLVLWGIHLFLAPSSQRSPAPLRVFHTLLCCQTLLLIGLAVCKMGLYIRFCGVTWLRVCTTWFMVLLAVVFGLVLLSQFRKIPLARWIAGSFCALFLLLCYLDVNGLIVRSAIARYESSEDPAAITGSYEELRSCAVAGAPELRLLYLREIADGNSQLLPQLEGLLGAAAQDAQNWDGLSHWSLQRSLAAEASQGFLPKPALPEKPPMDLN